VINKRMAGRRQSMQCSCVCVWCFQRGYTFLAEAKSTAVPSSSGLWRLHLIGSANPLPIPTRSDFGTSSCNVLELHEYYVPNDKDIIFRYAALLALIHLCGVL